jgi:Tfp pilus assembly protein PilF
VARLVALQGAVEIQRADGEAWERVKRLDTALCPGDRLRTGALSRAGLHVVPETIVRVDQNTVITLNHSAEEIAVEFFVAELAARAADSHSCGAGYFITRFPKKFKVRTPHMNAAVEGTEFMVETSCDASRLTVLEGRVSSESAASGDRKLVEAGQSLASGAAGPGAIMTVVRPADAVQWVLRFPPISDQPHASGLPGVAECAALTAGDLAMCLTARAEGLLRSGGIDDALSAIDAALAVDNSNSNGHALRSIVQVAKNDKSDALASAERATALGADNFRAWLALSNAQQAAFDLDAALASAKRSQALEPGSSLAHARVAELLLSLGDTRRAEDAARAAVASKPAESHGHSILGFVHLARIDTRAAQENFRAAIERDSFSALPRLGLGLAMIRKGDLVAGREQLEIAVALDPLNSLLRSYVGKAYYEENEKLRDALAATQFGLAKQLDPGDPTPWFYDAVLAQSLNRPIESLRSIQRSIELNDNRIVYRSRLLLDDDLAARSAQLGKSYQELGFDELARAEAYRSIEDSPLEYAGHRLLAVAFLDRPRHQVARVSELLQSQLQQPLDVSPVDAQLIDDRSLVLRHAGPTTLGLNEFNPLFVEDGPRLDVSGLVGGNETIGNQVLLSGVFGRFSATVGQFYYDTNGFQDGWGLRKSINSLFVQGQPSPGTSLLGEIRSTEQTEGDVTQNFFGTTDSQRLRQDRELIRAGFRFPVAKWSIAAVVTQQDANDVTEVPAGSLFFTSESDELSGELVAAFRTANGHVLTGAGKYDVDGVIEFFGMPFDSQGDGENAFAYLSHELLAGALQLELGLSWDKVHRPDFFQEEIEEFSPKFGVVIRPQPDTTFRVAAFRALRRSLIAEQTVEPTHVAGFNQFYNDDLGTTSERFGIGWDQKLNDSAFLGVELSKRELEIPEAFSAPPNSYTWNEKDYRAYGYFMHGDTVTYTVGYTYERITQHRLFAENFLDAETHKFPLGVSVIGRNTGISTRATVTYVRQEGEFRADPALPDFVAGESNFWIADISAEYRIPGRRGLITAEVRNAFDERFDFQETDIFSPTMARERLFFLRLGVTF